MAKFFSAYILARLRVSFLSIFILSGVSLKIFSQTTTSADLQSTQPASPRQLEEADTAYHSPRKAALYSAVLPGLGQIYNRKYWKVPIIYAGFGTLGYFIVFNNIRFNEFKQAYKDFPDYKLDYPYPLTLEQIDRGMIFYKRYRDLSILGTIGFWLFQVIDATVDAHLFDWNVSEDLSLRFEPSLVPQGVYGQNCFGFRACLSF